MISEGTGNPVHLGRVLISRDEIETRVRELAREISTDYAGRTPVFISLLKGGFIFLADLVRHLTIPHEIDFITVRSYGSGFERSERIEIVNDMARGVAGRDVIVIDGIVDTGHTLSVLEELLLGRKVRSLRVCALLDKPSCREITVPVHYVGFRVPDVFVVGYGLDFMERYRNLSHIAELVPVARGEAAAAAAAPAESVEPETGEAGKRAAPARPGSAAGEGAGRRSRRET
jgi:hypoxanthine phosphoribosyltransferase